MFRIKLAEKVARHKVSFFSLCHDPLDLFGLTVHTSAKLSSFQSVRWYIRFVALPPSVFCLPGCLCFIQLVCSTTAMLYCTTDFTSRLQKLQTRAAHIIIITFDLLF